MVINRRTICDFGVFLIILISFTKSLFRTLYGGNTGAMLVLTIGLLLIFISNIKGALLHYKMTLFSLLWLAVLGVALFNNYDLKNGNRLAVAQLVIGTLLVLLLQSNDNWCLTTIKMVKKFSMFNFIVGLFFLFNKTILLRYIVPLFHLDSSSEYYSNELVNQINNGYMTGLTSHYSTMGIYMSIGVCFFAASIFNNKDRIEKKDLIGIFIMLLGTFLSGKRSALLFPTISVFVVYFIFFKPKNISRRYNYIALIIVVCLMAALTMTMVPGISGGALGRISEILGSNNINDITNKRYEMLWLPALALFRESPITGIGWGNFKYSFTRYYVYTANQNNAHNVYLQLLCETGIVGTFIVLSTMFASIITVGKTLYAWRKEKIVVSNSRLAVMGVSMSMQIYFLLYSLSGNPLYDIQCYLPYMVAVAMGVTTSRCARRENCV